MAGVIRSNGRAVTLADGDHIVKFDMNHVVAIEERYGGLDLSGHYATNPFGTTRWLLALVKGISEDEAGKLLTGVPLANVTVPLTDSISEAVGIPPEEAPTPAPDLATPPPVVTPAEAEPERAPEPQAAQEAASAPEGE